MKEAYLLSLLLAPYYFVQSNVTPLEQDFTSYGCVCKDFNCGCCAHLEVPKIGLNDTGCVNLTYLPKEYGISFTVTLDNLVIYNETISARNPPPICFGAPMLKEYAELCVHFYDLDVSRTKAHGCVQLEARLHKVVVATYKIGCFDIGNPWKKYHVELIDKILKRERNKTLKLA